MTRRPLRRSSTEPKSAVYWRPQYTSKQNNLQHLSYHACALVSYPISLAFTDILWEGDAGGPIGVNVKTMLIRTRLRSRSPSGLDLCVDETVCSCLWTVIVKQFKYWLANWRSTRTEFVLKYKYIYYVSKFQRWNWEGQHFLKSPWRGDSVSTSFTTFQRNFTLSISWPSGKAYIVRILLKVCSKQLNNSASRAPFILSSSICPHCSNRLRKQQ